MSRQGGNEFSATQKSIDTDLVAADILVVADFSHDELAWRLESEIRSQAEFGYRVALIHVSSAARGGATIHPDIGACVAEGLADPVQPSAKAVKASLALVYEPETLFGALFAGRVIHLPRVLAERVIAIGGADTSMPLRQVDVLLRSLFGSTTVWTAETKNAQTRIRQNGLRTLDETWSTALPSFEPRPLREWRRTSPVIGTAGSAALSWLRSAPAAMAAALSANGQALVRVFIPTDSVPMETTFPEDWEIVADRETSLRTFLTGLDLFLFTPGDETVEPPVVVIATALSMGIPVVLHPRLEPVFGDAAVYADSDNAPLVVDSWLASGSLAKWDREGAASTIRRRFGAQNQSGRMAVLAGAPTGLARRTRVSPSRRAIFFSSDTVGLGHLTRQLAVARRLPANIEPVFVTTSQAFKVAAQSGFRAEYLPSFELARFDRREWERWLAESLNQFVDQYDARAIIFDGASPHDGLLETLSARRNVASAWIRRGLWRRQHTKHVLDRQSRFTLVIAPTDVASAKDQGATIAYRRGVLEVPPIRLLDETELFSRKEAAERIGIDPARPAVLIQLGGSGTRDVTSIISTLLEALATRPEVQPVIADWNTAPLPDDLWPTVRRLRAFPLSRYFPAFDFTISAAGYNSFNEIVSFGLPAIFLPNDSGSVDDQPARAAYAEEQSAGLCFMSHEGVQLRVAINTLLQERARWFLSDNCRRIALPNGAGAAAEAIGSLV